MDAGALDLRIDARTLVRLHGGALTRAGEPAAAAAPLSLPCPRERADELAAVRSWLTRHPTRVAGCGGVAPSEPVDGGATIARILGQMRQAQLPPLTRPGRTQTPG